MTTATDAYRQRVYDHYGLTCLPRYATLRDFSRPTYGGQVAKVARALGTPLMPWQRYTADVSLEIDPATKVFAYRNVGITVPRQSGKTSLSLPVMVHRGMAWQRQRIVYAAQSGTEARKKWEDDHVVALQESKLKGRFRVRKANAREAIIWLATRSMHGITTNTEKTGHGPTVDLGLADEYFAQVDYRIAAAMGPSMITRVMAQLWWLSTAGTSKSIPLNAERAAGRELVTSGAQSRTAYFEWSAPKGADHTDPNVWLSCMPALCPLPGECRCSKEWRHTVTIPTLTAELESASREVGKLNEWLRAYMNWTRKDDQVLADPNMPSLEAWNLLEDDHAEGGTTLACAVDINPLRNRAAIVAVGEGPDGPDGPRRGVVLEHGEGIDWVIEHVVNVNKQLRPVAWAIDERSPAATLIIPMAKAGITRMKEKPHRGGLWIPTTAEYGSACADWADGVREGTLTHPGQPVMKEALAVARSRPLGDGAWGFGRKVAGGDADITSLVAWALGLATYERYKDLAAVYDPLANIW